MKKFIKISKCILLGLFVILFPVISGVIITINRIENPNTYYIQALAIFIPTLIIIILLLLKRLNRKELFLSFTLNRNNILYILLSFIIFIPVAVKGFHSTDTKTFFGLLLLYLFVGISEELYFRVLIYNNLKEYFNLKWCIITSTLIFALGHSSLALSGANFFMTLLTIINALLFGLMAICLMLLTKSIYPLIFIHFLFDFETKFINLDGVYLLIAEIIRGTLMALLTIYFIIKLKKEKRKNIIQDKKI